MTMISENAVVVGAGHARDQKMVRGQHPQGVRRGCKGLKPQQHTQGPLLHGISDFTREQNITRGIYHARL
jgi:hypothetical protein